MSNNSNPFTQSRCDLGTDSTVGVSRQDIDTTFSNATNSEDYPCIYCTNKAAFRIIPKQENFNTAEIQDRGFICEHCAKQGYLSKENYGLRPFK